MKRKGTAEENESRISRLKKLRDTLAQAIDDCESMRDLPALARQYRETLKEIEELEGAQDHGDEIGELLARREAQGQPGAVRTDCAGV